MRWFRKKKKPARRKRSKPAPKRKATWIGAWAKYARYAVSPVVRRLWPVPLIAVLIWSVGRLEAFVLLRPEYRQAPTVHFADVPEYLRETMTDIVSAQTNSDWIEPDLCRRIGLVLEYDL